MDGPSVKALETQRQNFEKPLRSSRGIFGGHFCLAVLLKLLVFKKAARNMLIVNLERYRDMLPTLFLQIVDHVDISDTC